MKPHSKAIIMQGIAPQVNLVHLHEKTMSMGDPFDFKLSYRLRKLKFRFFDIIRGDYWKFR